MVAVSIREKLVISSSQNLLLTLNELKQAEVLYR
jgi:hypothetical protein